MLRPIVLKTQVSSASPNVAASRGSRSASVVLENSPSPAPAAPGSPGHVARHHHLYGDSRALGPKVGQVAEPPMTSLRTTRRDREIRSATLMAHIPAGWAQLEAARAFVPPWNNVPSESPAALATESHSAGWSRAWPATALDHHGTQSESPCSIGAGVPHLVGDVAGRQRGSRSSLTDKLAKRSPST